MAARPPERQQGIPAIDRSGRTIGVRTRFASAWLLTTQPPQGGKHGMVRQHQKELPINWQRQVNYNSLSTRSASASRPAVR